MFCGVYTGLSAINGLMKDSPKKTKLGELVDQLSFITRDDALGTFKLPGEKSVNPAAIQPPGGK